MEIESLLASSGSEVPTSSIMYARAVSDSENGIVRVVFVEEEQLDDDGDPIGDIVLDDDDDATDTIEDDYEANLLGPDDEGYIEGHDTYVNDDDETIVDYDE